MDGGKGKEREREPEETIAYNAQSTSVPSCFHLVNPHLLSLRGRDGKALLPHTPVLLSDPWQPRELQRGVRYDPFTGYQAFPEGHF